MRSGHIQQFTHLKQFQSLNQFNQSMNYVLKTFANQLTKGQLIALKVLSRFSVKEVGICNARLCKLVEAAQKEQGGVSRSTFERMLRKAKQLGILSIYPTFRSKGGYSHNVYVFNLFDESTEEKMTKRQNPEKLDKPRTETNKNEQETVFMKSNKNNIKENRHIKIEELDYTYVPGYVPEQWTKVVKTFYPNASDICKLWDRVLIAYRNRKLTNPIEDYLPVIIKAFKQTVFQYKRGKIKTSSQQYFYGAVVGVLTVEARREYRERNQWRWRWLEG